MCRLQKVANWVVGAGIRNDFIKNQNLTVEDEVYKVEERVTVPVFYIKVHRQDEIYFPHGKCIAKSILFNLTSIHAGCKSTTYRNGEQEYSPNWNLVHVEYCGYTVRNGNRAVFEE